MRSKKGISLIVLVITILVMIILAGVVIVNMSENNPINKAKEAQFKSNLKIYIDELERYHAAKLTDPMLSEYNRNAIDASKEKITYGGGISSNFPGNISNIITAMRSSKDLNSFEIAAGEIIYVGKNKDELKWCHDLGIYSMSFDGQVNRPMLTSGMIPVYFDKVEKVWKKADVTNKNKMWYDYEGKMWANVVTVEEPVRTKYLGAAVGTTVNETDINAFLVWIPRFAYSITGGAYQVALTDVANKIDVKFLKGVTNIDANGKKYEEDYAHKDIAAGENTPTIVHPAFRFGSRKVSGIWVSKFEISGSPNAAGKYPGNSDVVGGKLVLPQDLENENTYLKIIPGVPTWRHKKISEHFEICRNMLEKNSNKYGITNADSHMIKNVEWGAVAYLSASKYGVIPEPSRSGSYIEGAGHYDVIAGTTDYKTNVNVSTTGNITGIYDMNGCSYEVVAAYIDNGDFGRDGTGVLQKADKKYVDVYPDAKEVLDNKIKDTVLNDGSFLTIDELYAKDHTYNSIRNRLSLECYKNMGNIKGDATYEAIQPSNYSFIGKLESGVEEWIKINAGNSQYQRSFNWCRDLTLIPTGKYPYFQRGGAWGNGTEGGIFGIYGDHGSSWSGVSTRVVII